MSGRSFKNIVIVTQFFPPSNAIAARRFGEMVPYFEEFGYRPWIVTTECEGPLYQPIPREQVLQFSTFPSGRVALESWSSDRALYRMVGTLGFRTLMIGRQSLSWSQAVINARETITQRIQSIDCILGSFGPTASFQIASKLAHQLRVPWIADFRDVGAHREDGRNFLVKWLDQMIEKRFVESAQGITTVSETLRSILMRKYRKETEVVYNGYDTILERHSPLRSLPQRSEQPYFYYAGQLYPHQMASVKLFLDTLASHPTMRVIFRILGPRYLERQVRQKARELRLGPQALLLPPCEPDIVNNEAERAMANLVFENLYPTDEHSKGTITGKLLRLLPLAVPILVVARSDSDIAPILHSTQKGRLCTSAQEIEAFITQISDHPFSFHGDHDAISSYSKREQSRKLCRFLDRILGVSSGSEIPKKENPHHAVATHRHH